MYLIDELPMTYDVNLFSNYFKSNGSYVFGSRFHEMPDWVVEINYKN